MSDKVGIYKEIGRGGEITVAEFFSAVKDILDEYDSVWTIEYSIDDISGIFFARELIGTQGKARAISDSKDHGSVVVEYPVTHADTLVTLGTDILWLFYSLRFLVESGWGEHIVAFWPKTETVIAYKKHGKVTVKEVSLGKPVS